MKTVEEIRDFLIMSEKVLRGMMSRPGIKIPELMALNERAMTLQMIIDYINCDTLDDDD